MVARAALLATLAGPSLAAAQAGTVAPGGLAGPGVVNPTSYDMMNGNTGSWRYLDHVYPDPDAGTNSGALSGGTGLLTNGVAAPDNWNQSALNPVGGFQGYYVGWDGVDPTITFNFAQVLDFTDLRIHFDISNEGGVGAPGPVTINGVVYSIALPGGAEPFWENFDIGALAPTNQLVVSLTRTNSWVMVSEIDFAATVTPTAAPEPATVALVGLGLLGVGAAARRRGRVA